MTSQEKEEARSEMTCAQMESYFKEALNSGWDPLEVDDWSKRNIIQELFSQPYNDFEGYTPAEKSNLCKLVLEHGLDPNSWEPGCHWDSPLCLAIKEENHEAVKVMLEHGADPNLPGYASNYSFTPLMGAISKRNESLACLLMEHGADPNGTGKVYFHQKPPAPEEREARDFTGDNDLSCGKRDLVAHKATPMFYAAAIGHAPLCVALLEKGASLETKVEMQCCHSDDGDDWGRWEETPLQIADRLGHSQVGQAVNAHFKQKHLEKTLARGPKFGASDVRNVSPRPIYSNTPSQEKGRSRL